MTDEEKQIREATIKYCETHAGMYQSGKESDAFEAGIKSDVAKKLHTKGMYSEEEVLSLFNKWLSFKIEEELMRISGDIDETEATPFIVWFDQHKKK